MLQSFIFNCDYIDHVRHHNFHWNFLIFTFNFLVPEKYQFICKFQYDWFSAEFYRKTCRLPNRFSFFHQETRNLRRSDFARPLINSGFLLGKQIKRATYTTNQIFSVTDERKTSQHLWYEFINNTWETPKKNPKKFTGSSIFPKSSNFSFSTATVSTMFNHTILLQHFNKHIMMMTSEFLKHHIQAFKFNRNY